MALTRLNAFLAAYKKAKSDELFGVFSRFLLDEELIMNLQFDDRAEQEEFDKIISDEGSHNRTSLLRMVRSNSSYHSRLKYLLSATSHKTRTELSRSHDFSEIIKILPFAETIELFGGLTALHLHITSDMRMNSRVTRALTHILDGILQKDFSELNKFIDELDRVDPSGVRSLNQKLNFAIPLIQKAAQKLPYNYFIKLYPKLKRDYDQQYVNCPIAEIIKDLNLADFSHFGNLTLMLSPAELVEICMNDANQPAVFFNMINSFRLENIDPAYIQEFVKGILPRIAEKLIQAPELNKEENRDIGEKVCSIMLEPASLANLNLTPDQKKIFDEFILNNKPGFFEYVAAEAKPSGQLEVLLSKLSSSALVKIVCDKKRWVVIFNTIGMRKALGLLKQYCNSKDLEAIITRISDTIFQSKNKGKIFELMYILDDMKLQKPKEFLFFNIEKLAQLPHEEFKEFFVNILIEGDFKNRLANLIFLLNIECVINRDNLMLICSPEQLVANCGDLTNIKMTFSKIFCDAEIKKVDDPAASTCLKKLKEYIASPKYNDIKRITAAIQAVYLLLDNSIDIAKIKALYNSINASNKSFMQNDLAACLNDYILQQDDNSARMSFVGETDKRALRLNTMRHD